MKAIIRPALHHLLQRTGSIEHYHLLRARTLDEIGWTRSIREAKPVNREGQPLPWITYSAIHFLEPRLTPAMMVFEYGSGASTHWWASRVGNVVTCEHDAAWAAAISSTLPANARLRHVALGDGRYARQVLDEGLTFDIVMIDGRERVACADYAVRALAPQGVIIWDNSDRDRYREGLSNLERQGFRRIQFSGLVPSAYNISETSVLYRDRNCLGI